MPLPRSLLLNTCVIREMQLHYPIRSCSRWWNRHCLVRAPRPQWLVMGPKMSSTWFMVPPLRPASWKHLPVKVLILVLEQMVKSCSLPRAPQTRLAPILRLRKALRQNGRKVLWTLLVPPMKLSIKALAPFG